MIFVTGDTHRLIDVEKLNTENFPEQKLMTRDDYLIIAGDFGGVWSGNEKDNEPLEFFNSKNYTTLFVAGNHENYDALYSYPVEEWNGGKVHRIRENVLHLMNGEIFNIDGRSIFVMGGATSVDKMFREEGISWWKEEEPSMDELANGLDHLEAVGHKVDYIITHTCPEKVRNVVFEAYQDFIKYQSRVEQFLDVVYEKTDYTKWYCGHIHIDKELLDYRIRVLYRGVVKLG
ncbi:MAG: metallophosphoesterase [Parasporobacterium sp.]|nr:metallophosphoesterase [Parasporobacterium sp.]